MKKWLMMCLPGALLTPAASADIIGVYVGAGYWQTSFTGEVGEDGALASVDELNLREVGSNIIWAHIEHPLPALPNLRLMHSQTDTQARSITTSRIRLGGVDISAEVNVLTQMDISHSDATLYYEVLDNWLNLDLGMTARYFDGYVDIRNELPLIAPPARSEIKGVLPMLYLNAQFEVPFANLTFGVLGNAIKYQGEGVVDLTAMLGYYVELGPLLDLGVNLGYRRMNLNVDDYDGMFADITADGPFAEFYIHF